MTIGTRHPMVFADNVLEHLAEPKKVFAEEDTFPTLYRANTSRGIHRIADSAGLTVTYMEFIEGHPEYLRIMAFT